MPDDRGVRHIPKEYDEYYLRIVRVCLNYACPTGAGLYMLFFLWDLLLIQSGATSVKTLVLRLSVSASILAFWFLSPRIRSLRGIMFGVSALYVYALLTLIVILTLIPNGLIVGVPGLMLVVMCANGMFCIRPMPAAISGLIGILALLGAYSRSRLSYAELASELLFFTSAVVVGAVFMILLDRELRWKHATELALEQEKEQSEKLLKEILPRYVIQRIREGAEDIAESVSEVNVIFIDIVGFTTMSRRLAPKHLVEVLGEIFRSFDDNCEEHGVTKIKTIGDAYMAATGAPEPSTLSAVAAVEFCLHAVRSVRAIAARTGIPISVRIGVATGAVISGVLSLKRPAYDLWGETVNLASRMESSSEPGRIHIAETTYWRVKDRFICEPRGLVEVKGLGAIQTYFIQSDPAEDCRHELAKNTEQA